MRLFNQCETDETAVVKMSAPLKEAYLVDLKEDVIEPLAVKDNLVEITLGGNKIGTLKLIFD